MEPLVPAGGKHRPQLQTAPFKPHEAVKSLANCMSKSNRSKKSLNESDTVKDTLIGMTERERSLDHEHLLHRPAQQPLVVLFQDDLHPPPCEDPRSFQNVYGNAIIIKSYDQGEWWCHYNIRRIMIVCLSDDDIEWSRALL